jgi:uncharacterized membrane protein YoaK (UPF0700 family)
MHRLLHLTDEERSPYLNGALGAICAFVAGGINAGGLVIIGRYTSHVTGIVSESTTLLVQHRWLAAAQLLILALGFGIGAIFASYTIQWAKYLKLRSPFSLALMSSGSTLIGLGLWAMHQGTHYPNDLLLEFGLFFAMGIQNATVTLLSNNDVRATHMTGIVTDLGIELGTGLFSRKDMNTPKFKLGILILGAFILGGLAGVMLFEDLLGIRALLLYGGILFALAALPIVKDHSITSLHYLKTHANLKK